MARGWRTVARRPRGRGAPLRLESVPCDLCGPTIVEPLAVGEDFEYWTSPDAFLAVRCTTCGLVYLDPRPTVEELDRIYPPEYHAFDFSEERFGLVYKVRERLEARRVLRWAGGLSDDAVILDVGCGDGFHLDLLRRYGRGTWTVQGVEPDARAASAARARGLVVHDTVLADADIDPGSVDLAFLIQTIEHVPSPVELLQQVHDVLAPGGRLVVVTDNVGSPDFRIFRSRHWGGYHFPRHWHLYDRTTLAATAEAGGLEVESIGTVVSPVNWVYSLRNMLVDLRAPEWAIRPLSLEGSVALAAGTVLDSAFQLAGRGALLRGVFRRPGS
ncbi:methyltransferase domain-containing protein [Actinomarinicola tropica]|uniref:Methyltransferase domain-containing protein n=1 Tax=Actinomarinicola tropica TaxID=2789776 RepID=A0A5Q2RQ49_9ACTN|nr:methyltransferase domain-containing protein [Actinomarinicola tropica]